MTLENHVHIFMPKCFGEELGKNMRRCLQDKRIMPCEFIAVIH